MDDIDRAKIGKRDEKLVGWDWIRKPKMNTTYPPMRAKGARSEPYLRLGPPAKHQEGYGIGFWLAVLIVAIAVTKIMGFW